MDPRPALRAVLLAPLLTAATLAPAQQTVLPLWPHQLPEPVQTSVPETDLAKPSAASGGARPGQLLTNVTHPTLSVYLPHHPTGVAALVFPGGSYQRLAYTKEGADVCEWLNTTGIACLLVKYRVPQPPGEAGHFPADPSDLEDAQQAMRLARAHAAEWHLDPHKIGVIGFSAGGNLAVLLSTHPDDDHVASTPAAPDVPGEHGGPLDARPNFAIVVYPAYLAEPPAERELDPVYTPNRFTPPTFLLQAEDDAGYGRNALVYYRALMDAHLPGQLHYYATGGHGFGVHPVGKPEEHWTELANAWLRDIGMLPIETLHHSSGKDGDNGQAAPTPCPTPQPPQPGTPPRSTPTDPTNPNCFTP